MDSGGIDIAGRQGPRGKAKDMTTAYSRWTKLLSVFPWLRLVTAAVRAAQSRVVRTRDIVIPWEWFDAGSPTAV